MLSYLEDKMLTDLGNFHLQHIQNLWKFLIKLNIHNSSNYLSHLSSAHCGGGTAESVGQSFYCRTVPLGTAQAVPMNR
eukprot:14625270-Ditylum_brightwellii.AAC.1